MLCIQCSSNAICDMCIHIICIHVRGKKPATVLIMYMYHFFRTHIRRVEFLLLLEELSTHSEVPSLSFQLITSPVSMSEALRH